MIRGERVRVDRGEFGKTWQRNEIIGLCRLTGALSDHELIVSRPYSSATRVERWELVLLLLVSRCVRVCKLASAVVGRCW